MQCNNNGIAQMSLMQASMGVDYNKKSGTAIALLTIPVSLSMHKIKQKKSCFHYTTVLFGLLELCSNIIYGAIDP